MESVRLVPVVELVAEEFGPYGWVVEWPEDDSEAQVSTPEVTFFMDRYPLGMAHPTVGLLRAGCRPGVSDLGAECHFWHPELFLRVGGASSYILMVARAGPPPTLEDFKAFLVEPEKHPYLQAGVWHCAPPRGQGGDVKIALIAEPNIMGDRVPLQFPGGTGLLPQGSWA